MEIIDSNIDAKTIIDMCMRNELILIDDLKRDAEMLEASKGLSERIAIFRNDRVEIANISDGEIVSVLTSGYHKHPDDHEIMCIDLQQRFHPAGWAIWDTLMVQVDEILEGCVA